MTRTTVALAIMAALALPAWAQAPAPAAPKAPATGAPKAAAPKGDAKALYPQAQFDLMLKQRTTQGQPDTPELRAALREELNTRELLSREARKKGLDKTTDIKTEMDLTSQTVLVRAYVADWLKNNPVPEADLKREYDTIRSQIGDKEYKVSHILVEKEDEAKEVVVELQKGAKFPDVAKARSKDPGSKDRGGDLDWNAPANFVKPFSDAMVKAEKGKFTPQPVQTQFGWHIILVEDTREAKVPGYDEVKPQLSQRMQAQHLDRYFKELRAKNGL